MILVLAHPLIASLLVIFATALFVIYLPDPLGKHNVSDCQKGRNIDWYFDAGGIDFPHPEALSKWARRKEQRRLAIYYQTIIDNHGLAR